MGDFFSMMTSNTIGIVFSCLFAVVIIYISLRKLGVIPKLYKPKQSEKAEVDTFKPGGKSKGVTVEVAQKDIKDENKPKFRALIIKTGNIADFTYIHEPIGELYQADTSCPMSGGVYIVRQEDTEEKAIVDYDPRKVPIKTEETPEMAYFATHWDDVKDVYGTLSAWYKNAQIWLAIAVMVIVFIWGIVVIGG